MSMPSLTELEEAVKSIVHDAIQDGTFNTITVLAVLAKTEDQYNLESGVLRAKEYKRPLKAAIMAAADQRNTAGETAAEGSFSREGVDESVSKSTTKPVSSNKRRKAENKKQYKSAETVDSSGMEDEEPSPLDRKSSEAKVEDDESANDESVKVAKRRKVEGRVKKAQSAKKRESSNKEVQKKGQKQEKEGKQKSKGELSKDEATVKRLKSLVLACGVRKVWSKVLQGCDGPLQEVNKLKEILRELGMTGRYSLELAKRIKEQRELAQELEDVKSFEQSVMRKEQRTSIPEDEDSESEKDARPAKRKRNALQSITAFLDDQSDDN